MERLYDSTIEQKAPSNPHLSWLVDILLKKNTSVDKPTVFLNILPPRMQQNPKEVLREVLASSLFFKWCNHSECYGTGIVIIQKERALLQSGLRGRNRYSRSLWPNYRHGINAPFLCLKMLHTHLLTTSCLVCRWESSLDIPQYGIQIFTTKCFTQEFKQTTPKFHPVHL